MQLWKKVATTKLTRIALSHAACMAISAESPSPENFCVLLGLTAGDSGKCMVKIMSI
jgi:hypothetical protein